ncbi:hypothetical protein CLAFUW4_10744 [Fulvia fulva]|uniref:F-box domain-containing protein n=1 Tax=Passalora fulva TaxID=5499 RepID=A0A9Q8P7E2_PASFU|nr:uncharacterized protein CLAFUR5_05357 [Fulvia fulva]KAK4615955.1 hypothetical protein CLAFUR4_10749 [Fulvia fulva]KAK4616518.1 hypothetical protein CLAFUR0_10756 [Fulvia fulva]UJO16050.1 hypothetical protein CLAFUR5_05357 [Fulvia fulva]WPV18893.1 hypothetical protein CLAFUW4_10744 [Fulvia fulva]WPV33703.1 hypothetical protein CLAFUW7_10746 [Fulvia fulva]
MKASQRTFDIAELRDQILQYLPAKDLLLLQRVNGAWHQSISTESSTQFRAKAMLFQETSSEGASTEQAPRFNKLILNRLKRNGQASTIIQLDNNTHIELALRHHLCHHIGWNHHLTVYMDEHAASTPLPAQSQYDMYLVQSSLTIFLEVKVHSPAIDKHSISITALVKAARLGDVVKAAQKLFIWAGGNDPRYVSRAQKAEYKKKWKMLCSHEDLEMFCGLVPHFGRTSQC